jgi:membrane protease YdiL (CAAX protease family)
MASKPGVIMALAAALAAGLAAWALDAWSEHVPARQADAMQSAAYGVQEYYREPASDVIHKLLYVETDQLDQTFIDRMAEDPGVLAELMKSFSFFNRRSWSAAFFSNLGCFAFAMLTAIGYGAPMAAVGLQRGSLRAWQVVTAVLTTSCLAVAIASVWQAARNPQADEALRSIVRLPAGLVESWVHLAIVFTVVLAPISEEILFRGLLQRRLLLRWNAPVAITITGLVFALSHFGGPERWLAVLPAGLWLGFVAWRADSIWPSMLCHSANNAAIVGAGFTGALEHVGLAVVAGTLGLAGALVFIHATAARDDGAHRRRATARPPRR